MEKWYLREIAPGVNLERDILKYEFVPEMAEPLKEMDSRFFMKIFHIPLTIITV